jgi:hypothetical protein
MTRKAALVLLLFFLLIAFPRSASIAQQFQGPPELPRDIAGGRPGTFRFTTNEQLRADRGELAELRAGLDRLDRLLPRVSDPVTQRELSNQIERWSIHIARLEQRSSTPAGPTAATVEARLDQIKGQRNCGVCHGGPPETTRTMY